MPHVWRAACVTRKSSAKTRLTCSDTTACRAAALRGHGISSCWPRPIRLFSLAGALAILKASFECVERLQGDLSPVLQLLIDSEQLQTTTNRVKQQAIDQVHGSQQI